MVRKLIAVSLAAVLLPALALVVTQHGPSEAAAGVGNISGRLIHDMNGDGVASLSEPGLEGWTVGLEGYVDGELAVKETARTNRNGRYVFSSLPFGEYTVAIPCEGQPALWVSTSPNSAGEFTLLVEDEEDLGPVDFLLKTFAEPPEKNGSIQGRLVWDENRDGSPDPWEQGVGGWKVDASMMDEPKCFPEPYRFTYAAADGSFTFEGLAPGRYNLQYPGPSGLPHPDYVFSAPGRTVPEEGYDYFHFEPYVQVPEGGVGTVAIGVMDITGSGSISGKVYLDQSENECREEEEPLVDCGCWMGLMYRTPRGFHPVWSQLTYSSASGIYRYSDLMAGDYWVALLQPPGIAVNPPSNFLGYAFQIVTLGEGQSLTDIDFGLRSQAGQPLPTMQPPPPVPPTTTPDAPTQPTDVAAPATGSGPAGGAPCALPAVALVAAGLLGIGVAHFRPRRRAQETGEAVDPGAASGP